VFVDEKKKREEKRFEDVVSMLRGISKSLPKMSKELEYVTKVH
jgi:hypothetical protein